jgi:hypothetical protein
MFGYRENLSSEKVSLQKAMVMMHAIYFETAVNTMVNN